jgi:hypothetical protein
VIGPSRLSDDRAGVPNDVSRFSHGIVVPPIGEHSSSIQLTNVHHEIVWLLDERACGHNALPVAARR